VHLYTPWAEPHELKPSGVAAADDQHVSAAASMTTYAALDALFIRKGNAFEPTELTRGPWSANAQHGGAPAALLGRELERAEPGWPFARVDVQFVKPVPLAPLVASVEVEREGRRARRLRAMLSAEGDEVAFAEGLQLRPGGERVPAIPLTTRKLASPYAGSPPIFPDSDHVMFGGDAVELSIVNGAFDASGPAAAWFRLRVPLLADEEPSALQRTLAAADFGNGLSSEISWDDYTFVNPDLTIYLLRYPTGDWVALDSRTSIDPNGVGMAESVLHDEQGPFGRALQSLYVSRR
jgi:Thioesterase-like superfamily